MEINLKETHEELLILLKEFHKICTDHDIHYSLHGGTLLGAIRERGFIAWDDDADITLTRSEFEKLKAVLRSGVLKAEFRFDENSRFPKFIMKRQGKRAVWTDIFIYDYISEKPLIRKLKLLTNYFFVLFTRTKEEQTLSNLHGLYKGLGKFAMNFIVFIGSLFPMKLRLRWASANMQSFGGKKLYIHRANDQFVGIHMTLKKEIMDNYILTDFGDTELMVSANYHDILISSYGDGYMTPRKDKPTDMHAITFEAEQKGFEKLYDN